MYLKPETREREAIQQRGRAQDWAEGLRLLLKLGADSLEAGWLRILCQKVLSTYLNLPKPTKR